jgi:hypothetical protein
MSPIPKKEKKVKSSLVSIVIDPDLWKALQHQALDEKKSASEIVRTLITEYLTKVQKSKR